MDTWKSCRIYNFLKTFSLPPSLIKTEAPEISKQILFLSKLWTTSTPIAMSVSLSNLTKLIEKQSTTVSGAFGTRFSADICKQQKQLTRWVAIMIQLGKSVGGGWWGRWLTPTTYIRLAGAGSIILISVCSIIHDIYLFTFHRLLICSFYFYLLYLG